MVPISVIVPIVLTAFGISAFSYFVAMPKRLIRSKRFALMAGAAAIMLFTIGVSIVGAQIVWLSWVLLVVAIVWLVEVLRMLRTALEAMREEARRDAAERARRA